MTAYLIDDAPLAHAPRAGLFAGTPSGNGLPSMPIATARGLYRGNGYLAGTLAELDEVKPGTAVLLIDPRSRRPIDEQRSAADGSWRFDDLATDQEYLVLSLHPERQYNAVVAYLLQATP